MMFTEHASTYLKTEALADGIRSVTDKSDIASLVSSIQQLLDAA